MEMIFFFGFVIGFLACWVYWEDRHNRVVRDYVIETNIGRGRHDRVMKIQEKLASGTRLAECLTRMKEEFGKEETIACANEALSDIKTIFKRRQVEDYLRVCSDKVDGDIFYELYLDAVSRGRDES